MARLFVEQDLFVDVPDRLLRFVAGVDGPVHVDDGGAVAGGAEGSVLAVVLLCFLLRKAKAAPLPAII